MSAVGRLPRDDFIGQRNQGLVPWAHCRVQLRWYCAQQCGACRAMLCRKVALDGVADNLEFIVLRRC